MLQAIESQKGKRASTHSCREYGWLFFLNSDLKRLNCLHFSVQNAAFKDYLERSFLPVRICILFYLLMTFLTLALLALLHVLVVSFRVQYRNLRSDFNR